MVSGNATIINPQGMHMRPAQLFVTAMGKFPCDVTIVFGEKTVNAKSIMNVMAACMKQGSEIELRCDGPQEEEALKTALDLIASGLGD